MKQFLTISFKSITCGLAFFIGTILGTVLAGLLRLDAPAVPVGSDPTVLMFLLLLVSFAIGILLAFLASHVTGSFIQRWLLLAAFGWVIYSVATYIEAAIYTTFESASGYKVVMDLTGFLFSAALASAFFHPTQPHSWPRQIFSTKAWIWRLFVAWLAFPTIYLTFGKIVEPFVIDTYRQGFLELTAPSWSQIIPTQLVRSLMMLLVCLPFFLRWSGSRSGMLIGLTTAVFLLTGGFYMLQAYWFPVSFRLIHSMEILADSAVYCAVLAALFTFQKQSIPELKPVS